MTACFGSISVSHTRVLYFMSSMDIPDIPVCLERWLLAVNAAKVLCRLRMAGLSQSSAGGKGSND